MVKWKNRLCGVNPILVFKKVCLAQTHKCIHIDRKKERCKKHASYIFLQEMGFQVILIFYFSLISIFCIFFHKHTPILRKKILSKPPKSCILERELRQKITDFPQLDQLLLMPLEHLFTHCMGMEPSDSAVDVWAHFCPAKA